MIPTPVTRGDDGKLKHICQAARDLGVTRQHLRFVLIGERESKRLMQKVRELHPELLELYHVS